MSAVMSPHIEVSNETRAGRARIAGRRITVDDVVIMHLKLAQSVEEIAGKYALTLAEVHAALAYYYDHKAEIDRLIESDDAVVEAFRKNNPSKLQAKLKALRDG